MEHAPGLVDDHGGLDLAARRLGGMVLAASDEFFAPKERLIAPEPPVFRPGVYQDHGKWMDGWETRRRRAEGGELDWAVVRLGVPGVVDAVEVDCTHFVGNAPETVAIDGLLSDAPMTEHEAAAVPDARWRPLVARVPVTPGAMNRLRADVDADARVSHVRLRIWPDGGVARLRVRGRATPDWRRLVRRGAAVDLVAAAHGGEVVAANDAFFSPPIHMLLPGIGASMADGWETRRRRGAGSADACDWCVIRLGTPGVVRWLRLETHHFKGNAPERCVIEAAHAPGADGDAAAALDWTPLCATRLAPHAAHELDGDDVADLGVVSHVRLSIFPDGGISRLRVYGVPHAAPEPGAG